MIPSCYVRAAFAAALLTIAVPAPAADSSQIVNQPFVNGGITQDEADWMRQEAPRYPLEITMARRGEAPGVNDFLAEVQLRVIDSAGRVVVDRPDAGPIFLATLPDGDYTLEATADGQTKTQRVHVSRGRHSQVTFLWQ